MWFQFILIVDHLTLIWVGFLGVRFEVKLPPPLSKTCQNQARKFKFGTHSCVVLEKISFSAQAPLILLMLAFFCKKLVFFVQKKYLYSKQQCESCIRDFLVLFSVFVRQKVTVNENLSFTNSASGIRPLDCSNLAINQENDKEVTICLNEVIVIFFRRCIIALVKFRCWTKFHVNIFTGSGVRVIYFHKGQIRNPEIRNTPVSILPNICRLELVRDTTFGTDVSNEILLNTAKCQSYSFQRV